LSPVGSLEEAIPVFEAHIKGLVDTPEEYDQFVAATIRIINRQQGEIKIEDLARMLGISTRQLQRRFRRSAGLSPKQFARIRRVRAAATPLVKGESVNWAERALESGFSDQSHLSNEFTAITKRSPSSFARKIRKITHGSLTK
jgi:AraC-like DNA-binding protein